MIPLIETFTDWAFGRFFAFVSGSSPKTKCEGFDMRSMDHPCNTNTVYFALFKLKENGTNTLAPEGSQITRIFTWMSEIFFSNRFDEELHFAPFGQQWWVSRWPLRNGTCKRLYLLGVQRAGNNPQKIVSQSHGGKVQAKIINTRCFENFKLVT